MLHETEQEEKTKVPRCKRHVIKNGVKNSG